MSTKTIVSEYWSDDRSKHAVVCIMSGRYLIDFYEKGKYNHTILSSYEDKSLVFVEDAAEDYVLGHFKNYRDFR